jgi:hypothetical protein
VGGKVICGTFDGDEVFAAADVAGGAGTNFLRKKWGNFSEKKRLKSG